MTQKTWNRLSLFEQLSNIDGEVTRLIQAHKNYLDGIAERDGSADYLEQINRLIRMTVFDPKNSSKGYRALELLDEYEQIRAYLRGEIPEEELTRYWHQYTDAIS